MPHPALHDLAPTTTSLDLYAVLLTTSLRVKPTQAYFDFHLSCVNQVLSLLAWPFWGNKEVRRRDAVIPRFFTRLTQFQAIVLCSNPTPIDQAVLSYQTKTLNHLWADGFSNGGLRVQEEHHGFHVHMGLRVRRPRLRLSYG